MDLPVAKRQRETGGARVPLHCNDKLALLQGYINSIGPANELQMMQRVRDQGVSASEGMQYKVLFMLLLAYLPLNDVSECRQYHGWVAASHSSDYGHITRVVQFLFFLIFFPKMLARARLGDHTASLAGLGSGAGGRDG